MSKLISMDAKFRDITKSYESHEIWRPAKLYTNTGNAQIIRYAQLDAPSSSCLHGIVHQVWMISFEVSHNTYRLITVTPTPLCMYHVYHCCATVSVCCCCRYVYPMENCCAIPFLPLPFSATSVSMSLRTCLLTPLSVLSRCAISSVHLTPAF